MRAKSFGIALIILGIEMTVYTSFNYVTRDTIVDIGLIQIDKANTHPVQWSPIIGLILLVAGIVVIVEDRRRRA